MKNILLTKKDLEEYQFTTDSSKSLKKPIVPKKIPTAKFY